MDEFSHGRAWGVLRGYQFARRLAEDAGATKAVLRRFDDRIATAKKHFCAQFPNSQFIAKLELEE